MAEVVFVHPPHTVLDNTHPSELKHEGLGVCYMASCLREKGHHVSIIDAQMEGISLNETVDKVSKIASDGCELIGISFAGQAWTEVSQCLVERLRKCGVESHITVGGHFATFEARNILIHIPEIDSVVRGEGEHAIVELVECLQGQKSLREVKGLVYRLDHQIIENDARDLIEDLDSLPFPARDTISPVLKEGHRVAILSQRGCYGRCVFCSVPAFYGRPGARLRSAKNVVDEIEHLGANHGARRFVFNNDDFADRSPRSKEWVKEFCSEISTRQLDIDFRVPMRASDCVEDILMPLKEAGLRELYVGVESMSQGTLNRLNKHISVEDNVQAIKLADRLGLRLAIGIIMFEPDMAFEELKKTYTWLSHFKYSGPHHYYNHALPFTGTPLREKLIQEGRLIVKTWYDIGTYTFRDPQVEKVFKNLQTLKPRILELETLAFQAMMNYNNALAHIADSDSDTRAKYRKCVKILAGIARKGKAVQNTVVADVFGGLLKAAEIDDQTIVDECSKQLDKTLALLKSEARSVKDECKQIGP